MESEDRELRLALQRLASPVVEMPPVEAVVKGENAWADAAGSRRLVSRRS